MITQLANHVVDCPMCRRPVDVQSQYAGQELRCGRCGGLFDVSDTDDGLRSIAALGRTSLLDKADGLLRRRRASRFGPPAHASGRLEVFAPRNGKRDDCGPEVSPAEGAHTRDRAESVTLLVEHRDEVFARIAADLRAAGMRVTRAESGTEALQLCDCWAPPLIIASVNLPDQSGWLFAAKVRLVDRTTPVWLYQARSTRHEREMADYLHVDELLDYGGDLLCLSETISHFVVDEHMSRCDPAATPKPFLPKDASSRRNRPIFRAIPLTMLTIALVGWFGSEELYAAPCCESGSKTASRENPGAPQHSVDHARQQHADQPFRAPHGGQLSKTTWNYFEVVYGPQETRVYVYDMFRFPVPARGMQGQVIMQVRSNGGKFRYPLQPAPGSDGQDYLVLRVDLTRVRNGDMDVHFDLGGLPNRESPTVRFSQAFALPRPPVAVADATAPDRAAVARQRTCPVMDSPLGDPGTPIKVSINGQSLFVCCRNCVDEVARNPDRYFQNAAAAQVDQNQFAGGLPGVTQRAAQPAPTGAQSQVPQVIATAATAADEAAIRAQRVCPVMNQPLGSHGRPIKLLVGNQPIYVCCQGCISKVQADPQVYVAKVVGTGGSNAAPRPR